MAADASLARPSSPRWRRAAGAVALLFGGGTLLVAVLHVGPLKPLLGRMFGSASSCPVSVTNLSAKEIDDHRVRSSAILAGTASARSHAAGPFVVGKTTRAEVDAWSKAAAVSCTLEQADTALRCVDVDAKHLGGAASQPRGKDTFFRFSVDGRLVGLDIMREPCDGARAQVLASDLVARVTRDVGDKSAQRGEIDASYFDAPGIRATMVEFRFADYAVDVSVMRMSTEGLLSVREQYRAVDKS